MFTSSPFPSTLSHPALYFLIKLLSGSSLNLSNVSYYISPCLLFSVCLHHLKTPTPCAAWACRAAYIVGRRVVSTSTANHQRSLL